MREIRPTFCRLCEAGCGLLAHVEDGRIVELSPDREHVVSQGYACIKGVRYGELHHSPDRLTTPLKRVGERFEPVSWDQALAEIGEKLRDIRETHGAQAIGLYAGNPIAHSLTHQVFLNGLVRAIGTRQLYGAGSQDCNNKFAAADAMYGSPLLQPIPDFDRVRCFIIIGSNPAVSQMTFVHAPRAIERLRGIENAGGKVVFVNPRRTESARQVGQQVFIRPGMDVFFLLAFANEVFARGAVDANAARHLENLEELRRFVEPWTPERCAAVTRIEASTLRALVDDYCQADGGVLYAATGLNQGDHGTLAFWLLSAINAITGNLDRRGGTLVPRGVAYWMHRFSVKVGQTRSRVDDLPSVLEMFPAGVLADEILTPGEGQLKALIVSAGNPVLSCANESRLREALGTLPLLVSVDMFRNETGNLAHYVLPVPSFLEREDVPLSMQGWQPVPFAQFSEAVVPPLGESKEEWWIYTRLLDAMGLRMFQAAHPFFRFSTRQLPRALRAFSFSPRTVFRALLALSRTSPGRLARRHPHGKRLAPLRAGNFLGHWVPRANGKVDVAPAAFVAAADDLERAFTHECAQPGMLKLISKRERHTMNSWLHNAEGLTRGAQGRNHLHVHPDDGARLGLVEGGDARVRNEAGNEITLAVRFSDDLMPGVVAVPHGWGRGRASGLQVARATSGANVNVLARDGAQNLERFAGMTRLTGLPVEVSPAG